MISCRRPALAGLFFASLFLGLTQGHAKCAAFDFKRDTFAFKNATVLKYKHGHPTLRRQLAADPTNKYTRRCFVMSRSVIQFRKFARFDPRGAPLDDKQLAARIRAVGRRGPWEPPLPDNQRIVFPGYSNLRQMSRARVAVFEKNLGSGFATYFRPANARMFFEHSREYQEKTQANLDAALARGDLFVAYLSTFPQLTINHAVLIYGRKPKWSKGGLIRYLVYDPNHPDSPREITWSPRDRAFAYQQDVDFAGGFVRVYQSYGKPLQ
jgi:hypothetical protein